MTRSNAREIVMHMVFAMGYTGMSADDALSAQMDDEVYAHLREATDVYRERPNRKQLAYIRACVQGIPEHLAELNGYIEKYAINWNLNRISRVARTIIQVAIYEILYVEDVPTGAAVDEAVELSKKYEDDEVVSFVNGVLYAFVRGEGK